MAPIYYLNRLIKLYMHIYFYIDLLEFFMEVPVLAFDTYSGKMAAPVAIIHNPVLLGVHVCIRVNGVVRTASYDVVSAALALEDLFKNSRVFVVFYRVPMQDIDKGV